MKTYHIKEIFGPTLQGEGLHAGAPCLFIRLSGCNAWDGRADTRADSACPYCDTDFRGGDRLDWPAILDQLTALLPDGAAGLHRLGCVLTGGEPLLQADAELLEHLGAHFSWVDVETNGTRACPPRPANVLISCSPKKISGQPIVVQPDWWKILIPAQSEFLPMALASGLPVLVQPVCPDAGPHGSAYTAAVDQCQELCYRHGCRMSVQLHKYLGIR